jgi:hypothetical protein
MTLHVAWTITGTVDDIYRPGAITAAADDSLEQVVARLQDKDISALVILDGDRLAGIITERDIARAVADRRDLAEGTAGEYMTWEPATVELETLLRRLAAGCWPMACATCRWQWPVRDRHSVGQGSAGTRKRHKWLTRESSRISWCNS